MAATTIRTAAQQVIEARTGEPIEDTIRRLYAEGKTQQQVAEELGTSRASIVRWFKRLGLVARRPGERVAA